MWLKLAFILSVLVGTAYPCEDGKYGPTCDKDCPDTCQTCTANNMCQTCKAHYDGHACQYCIAGKYGPQCDQDCPSGCKYSTCYRSNGHCHQCKEGLRGNKCTVSCSPSCEDGCYKDSGMCVRCVPSYYGQYCNIPCPENCTECESAQYCNSCKKGHHGTTCTNECSANCKNGSCHSEYGYCTEGCIDGYHFIECDQKCPIHCVTCHTSTNCNACELGFHGSICQHKCGHCKLGTPCGQTDGSCSSRCIDGYYGRACSHQCKDECKTCSSRNDLCESCINGKYGQYPRMNAYKCDKDCPANCLNKSCDRDTGNCLACVDGYTGDKCDCPEQCQTCSSPGVCSSCKAGYKDIDKQCTCRMDVCTTSTCKACANSTWYVDKANSSCCKCSSKCKNRECSSENLCVHGCMTGYYGEGCRRLCRSQDQKCVECKSIDNEYGGCTMCADGFYPNDNNGTCISCRDRCINGACESTNGTCTEGCIDKMFGEKCDKECPKNCFKCDRGSGQCLKCSEGKYSIDCSKNCSDTCNMTEGQLVCSFNDGFCVNGCNSDAVYGPQCKQLCNDGCIQNKCDWKTGRCLLGCEDNVFGDNCNATCSVYCVDVDSKRRCSANNGSCIRGCWNGFYGDRCDAKCSKYCLNDTCFRAAGVCEFGCIAGYSGDTCSHYMSSSVSQLETSTAWSVIGALIGVAVVIVIVISVIVFICVRRRCTVKAEQVDNPLETIDHPGDNRASGYESLTNYEVLGEKREAENEYSTVTPVTGTSLTVTPVSGTSRTVTPVYGNTGNQNRCAVKVDTPLDANSHPGETNASEYDSATTYEALRDRPETENEYTTVNPEPSSSENQYITVISEPGTSEHQYITVISEPGTSESQYSNI